MSGILICDVTAGVGGGGVNDKPVAIDLGGGSLPSYLANYLPMYVE